MKPKLSIFLQISFYILFTIITSEKIASQDLDFAWAKQINGIGDNIFINPLKMQADKNGDIIIAGYFHGQYDFDPSPNSSDYLSSDALYADFFIAKYNTIGNLIWAEKIGGVGADYCYKMVLDSSGNIFLTGYFQGAVDFDPGPNKYQLIGGFGQTSGFVAKYDNDGKIVFAKAFGGDGGTVYPTSITLDLSKNIYITGYFNGNTADFDPGPGHYYLDSGGTNGNKTSGFVLKLDSGGNLKWVKQYGGLSYDIKVDKLGNVITVGTNSSTNDFDPGPGTLYLTSKGMNDVFVCKLDPKGDLIWAKQFGGIDSDSPNNLVLDQNGSIFISGYFYDSADFDPGPASFTLTETGSFGDIFIVKLNSSGNFIFAKQIGGYSSDLPFDMFMDQAENVYITGFFIGTVDFDPGPGIFNLPGLIGTSNAFALKLNNSGNFIWAKQFGKNSQGNSIILDNNKNLYVTGQFSGLGDYDPGPGTYNLTSDINNVAVFFLKLECKATTQSLNVNSCNSYTLNGINYSSTGIYTQILNNSSGCDSILTLNLTINKTSNSSINISACEEYSLNNQVYTSSGVYTQTIPNAAGCDSVITLNLNINKNTMNTISLTVCDQYVLNNQTYINSGIYTQTIPNAIGCDSVIILNLSINKSTDLNITQTACDQFVLNNQGYTNSGVYTQTITNAAGCDSTITLNLTINKSTVSSIIQTTCDQFILNGQTYTSSGVYTQKLTNTAGCDSTISLNLTINKSSSNSITKTACKEYLLNNQLYSNTGIYKQQLINAAGCDSTITLNLTIIKIDTSISVAGNTLTASQSNANYQWIDCGNNTPVAGANSKSFTPSKSGSYALVLGLQGCVDTSNCFNVWLTAINNLNTDFDKPSIYPNPNNGLFNIHLTQRAVMHVFNATGQVILNEDIDVGDHLIDIGHNATGIYLVKLTTGSRQYLHKLIVIK